MQMMKDMSPEDMMGMMHEMMPKMMGHCSEFMSMMHEEMPKMMESCFRKMSADERASMLSMCRSMLNDLEKKMAGAGPAGPGMTGMEPKPGTP